MSVYLEQLVYTSFANTGLKVLSSQQVPQTIEQILIEKIVSKLWNSYQPPKPGYRAVYLYQESRQQTLFGWFYNDRADDIGRSHLPYFLCYYLAAPLLEWHLETILACLQKGPLALVNRHSPPMALQALAIKNLSSYQPVRPGVAIPEALRTQCHTHLQQQQLLHLLVSTTARQTRKSLPALSQNLLYRQARPLETNWQSPSIRSSSRQGYQQRLQQYRQALLDAIRRSPTDNKQIHRELQRLQRSLKLTDKDIELVISQIARPQKRIQAPGKKKTPTNSIRGTNFVLTNINLSQVIANWFGQVSSTFGHKNVQVLLCISIVATVIALIASAYGLWQIQSSPRPPASTSRTDSILAKPDLT